MFNYHIQSSNLFIKSEVKMSSQNVFGQILGQAIDSSLLMFWLFLLLIVLVAVVIVFYVLKAVFQIRKDKAIRSSHKRQIRGGKKK